MQSHFNSGLCQKVFLFSFLFLLDVFVLCFIFPQLLCQLRLVCLLPLLSLNVTNRPLSTLRACRRPLALRIVSLCETSSRSVGAQSKQDTNTRTTHTDPLLRQGTCPSMDAQGGSAGRGEMFHISRRASPSFCAFATLRALSWLEAKRPMGSGARARAGTR